MRTGLFVGRFQPFHNGHLAAVRYSLERVDLLVVVIGSAQRSHEARNPFTAGERIEMIKSCLDSENGLDWRRLMLIPVPDIDMHHLWTSYVDLFVPRYDVVFSNDTLTKLLFREHGSKIDEPVLMDRAKLSATEVRQRIAAGKSWEELTPEPVAEYIRKIEGVQRIIELEERHLNLPH